MEAVKAAIVTKFGGPDVLKIRELPTPEHRHDQVLVRVRAIGLNFADIFARFGVYPGTPKPPFIPGLEFSGDVHAVGSSVTTLKAGDRVMGYGRLGSHAEFIAVHEFSVVPMPLSMSYETAAAFVVSNMTAYHGLVRLANVRRGERLLIHAAAGGAGIAAVQMGNYLGAEIFATAGTDEKVAIACAHGAHHGVNYRTSDFAAEVRRLTNGYGVDVVLDSVGGAVFRKSWKLLAGMGRYVLFGLSDVVGTGALNRVKAARTLAQTHPVFPPMLMASNKSIAGFNLGTLKGKETYFREAMGEILIWYDHGVVKPLVGRVFPFTEIAAAHHYLQTRQSVGKVVVRVGEM